MSLRLALGIVRLQIVRNLAADHVVNLDYVQPTLRHHEYLDDTGRHSDGHHCARVRDRHAVDLLLRVHQGNLTNVRQHVAAELHEFARIYLATYLRLQLLIEHRQRDLWVVKDVHSGLPLPLVLIRITAQFLLLVASKDGQATHNQPVLLLLRRTLVLRDEVRVRRQLAFIKGSLCHQQVNDRPLPRVLELEVLVDEIHQQAHVFKLQKLI